LRRWRCSPAAIVTLIAVAVRAMSAARAMVDGAAIVA
jgi:hypothetical protein